MIEFQGKQYFDDRMFVIYLCNGKIETDSNDSVVWTTIYHENSPKNCIWCVLTYYNRPGYPLYRIDSFYQKEDAQKYIRTIEPETPLISLNGLSNKIPLSFENYSIWKKDNNFKDYEWKSLYSDNGTNASETIGQAKEQFSGIK